MTRPFLLAAALAAALAAPALGAASPAKPSPPAKSPAASPYQPFHCPEGGPNSGNGPQAMAKSAGHTLVLCADTESEEGSGIVATGVAIHEPDSATPSKPLFSMVSDTMHMRIQPVPDRGFSVTWESLLPRGTDYQWTPLFASQVACGGDGCRERDARCALDLPASEKRDLLARVRTLGRSGAVEKSVAQRLIDDLTLQALLGDDVAAWAVEHLDRILALGPENGDGLGLARQLLERARAANCASLVPPPDEPPPPPPDPAARAAELKERIARSKNGSAAPAPAPEAAAPADLDAVGWLVGGRWTGRGTMPDGSMLNVEETYRWGPGRHSIRFRAQTAGAAAKNGSAVEGIVFFEPKAGKIVLWNVKPGGGLSESAVTRADAAGCEFAGADGRVRMSRKGDHQDRVVEQLKDGSWAPVVTAAYERHPK